MTIVNIKRWNKNILCQQQYYTPQMQALLQDLDRAIENPYKILKNDVTSTVVVLEVDNQLLVVKRANTKDWMHMIRRLFSSSRAKKNWRNSLKLLKIGIPTFTPVALIEECFGFLNGRSYFICTYIEGIDALHYFACGAKPQPIWRNVAVNIANMLQKLADNKLSHRDLNLSNILVIDNQPWLIDLDSMRHHWCDISAKKGALREQKRFMENWDEAPGVAPETVSLFQDIFAKLDTFNK
jgi:tRNA A-37 threonylcarbamoyl transferase component Bud32